MRRCARPDCGAEATVGLGHQPVRRSAWLIALADADPVDREFLVPLCDEHARSTRLPDGWAGTVEHGRQSSLWIADAVTSPQPSRAAAGYVRRAPATSEPSPETVEALELFADPGTVGDDDLVDLSADLVASVGLRELLAAPDLDLDTVAPPGGTDDAADATRPARESLRGARGPLLSRAFRASRVV